MADLLQFVMDAPPLGKRYPDTIAPNQEELFERVVALADWSPEKEANQRRLFGEGKVVFVDLREVDNALVKDGRICALKDVAGYMNKVPDGRHVQTDVGEGHQAVCFFPKSGWFVAGGQDVVDRIRLLDSRRDLED